MPRSGSGRFLAVLRGAGFAAALVIGAVGVWLIVTGSSQKSVRIGALAGFWALLLGAYSVFGSRAPQRGAVPEPVVVPAAPPPGQELDVRRVGEIERAAVAAARREFHAELQDMLRREVQAGIAQEVAGLRTEVAALRNELVEKVGGQLRLERIETTRLIGSDLEALQHELRQLRHVGGLDPDDDETHETARLTEAVDAVAVAAGPSVAPSPPVRMPAATRPAPPPEPESEREPEPVPDPEPAPQSEPEPEPAPQPEREPVSVAAGRSWSGDPFASMPRITPFTDFELDGVPSAPAVPVDGAAALRAGRHSGGSEDAAAPRAGRRRRSGDGTDDVLARILARERG